MYTRVYLLIQTIWHNDKSVTDSSGISRGPFAFCLLNPQFIGAVISSHHQIEWINIEFTSVICDNNGLLGSVLSARRPLEAGRAFSNPLYPPHTIGRSGNYFVAVTYPIQWNIGEAPLKCCCILFSIHNRCLCECQNKSRFFADFIRRDFYDILSIRTPALSSIETLGCSCCKYSLLYIEVQVVPSRSPKFSHIDSFDRYWLGKVVFKPVRFRGVFQVFFLPEGYNNLDDARGPSSVEGLHSASTCSRSVQLLHQLPASIIIVSRIFLLSTTSASL